MAEHPAVNRTVVSSSLTAGVFFCLFSEGGGHGHDLPAFFFTPGMTYCVNAVWYNRIAVRKKQVFGRCFHMSNVVKIILMLIYLNPPEDSRLLGGG